MYQSSYGVGNNRIDYTQEDSPNYNHNKNSDFFSQANAYLPIKSDNTFKRNANNPISNLVSDLLDNPVGSQYPQYWVS